MILRKLEAHEIACFIYKHNYLDKSDNLQFSKLMIFNNMLKLDNNYIFNLSSIIWSLSSAESFETIYNKLYEISKKNIY